MMEKQNRTTEKSAAGDAADLDEMVDIAAGKLGTGKKAVGRKAGAGIPPPEPDGQK